MQSLFLSCAGGLESVCQSELEQIGIRNPRSVPGGVRFFGDLKTIYRINLQSRVGIRLLLKLTDFECLNKNDLLKAVTGIDWKLYMSLNQTFHITAFVDRTHRELRNSQYTALVVKDGIADRFRKDTGSRPTVDKNNPDIHVFVHVHHNRGTIYLDSSGKPLSKRGYRQGTIHKASLNEALAAGIIRLTSWNGRLPIYDPMCGSGTFPIEAAMIASDYAPGLIRKEFGFMKWKNFDFALWTAVRNDAKNSIRIHKSFQIFGSDLRKDVLHLARQNARLLKGVTSVIQWDQRSVTDFSPEHDNGIIVMNPPYGIRTGDIEELSILYSEIGDMLKQRCQGHTAFMFTGNPHLAKKVGLKTSRKIPLRNGRIDCRLLEYELYSGSRKEKYNNVSQ